MTALPPVPNLPGAVTEALHGRQLTHALSDPGSVTSRLPDESLPAWQARAVRLSVFPMVRAAERETLLNDLAAAFGSLLDEFGKDIAAPAAQEGTPAAAAFVQQVGGGLAPLPRAGQQGDQPCQ